MRYTAATCDPDDFMDERYSLRQQLMSPPRQVELMIVMSESILQAVSLVRAPKAYADQCFIAAMYNEDDNLCKHAPGNCAEL